MISSGSKSAATGGIAIVILLVLSVLAASIFNETKGDPNSTGEINTQYLPTMGNYPMQKFTKMGKRNWIHAAPKRNAHSTKPDEFLDLIEIMSPKPYLEMFARKKSREGWDYWGNEV